AVGLRVAGSSWLLVCPTGDPVARGVRREPLLRAFRSRARASLRARGADDDEPLGRPRLLSPAGSAPAPALLHRGPGLALRPAAGEVRERDVHPRRARARHLRVLVRRAGLLQLVQPHRLVPRDRGLVLAALSGSRRRLATLRNAAPARA